jgi:DNA-binding CsgD family transcriptional regulator
MPSLAPGASTIGRLLALLVDVELAADDTSAAGAAADRLGSLAREIPTPYLRAIAALARGKLCVATATGDPRRCFVEALTLFARAELPVDAAGARMLLARAVADDRPEVAVAEARAALTTFERLGMTPEAGVASALLRELDRSEQTTGGLTRRETEVLGLVGEGLTNAEIGERLYISRKTVEHHVSRVLAKLGVRSRTEAAAHAVRTLNQKSGFA